MDTSLDHLTPDTRAKVEELLAAAESELGFTLRIRSSRRTCEEQNQLYAIGRTAPGEIVTKARGCMSWHVLGRAVDLDFVGHKATEADYRAVGKLAKARGWKWGGDFPGFPDIGHFEYHPGVAIESVCIDPTACDEAVERSFALAPEPPPQASSSGPSVAKGLLVGGLLGALGLLAWKYAPSSPPALVRLSSRAR